MRLITTALAAMLAATPLMAENRGVVVLNQSYEHADDVAGADGTAAADAMKAAGFRTVSGKDLNAGDLRNAVSDLLRPDESPGVRLVVLTGHFVHSGQQTWFMGTDSHQPDPVSVSAAGVSLATLMDLLADARPGAVLVLGTDDKPAGQGAGLQSGLGELSPPEGVTVLTGPAAAAPAVAAALLVPGTSVRDALDGDGSLRVVDGGNTGLVLMAETATDMPDRAAGANNLLEPDREAWAAAAATDTVDAYRAYLDRFPNGIYSAAAGARLAALGDSAASAAGDRDAWAEAAAANTPEAYRSYLARHPGGQYADAANRRLAELTIANQPAPAPAPTPRQTPSAAPRAEPVTPLQPAGQAEESRLGLSRSERMDVQRNLNALNYPTGGVDGALGSRSRNSIQRWQQANGFSATGYLTSAQVTRLRQQAAAQANDQRARDQAYWEQTGANGGARNLRAYLDRYPNGIYADRARARLNQANDGGKGVTNQQRARDRAYWEQTGANGGERNLRAYLDRYPNGIYADRARARLNNTDSQGRVIRGDQDDRAFTRARDLNTIQAYNTYLNNWPDGKYVRQARQARDQLRNRAQRNNNSNNSLPGLDAESIIRELLK